MPRTSGSLTPPSLVSEPPAASHRGCRARCSGRSAELPPGRRPRGSCSARAAPPVRRDPRELRARDAVVGDAGRRRAHAVGPALQPDRRRDRAGLGRSPAVPVQPAAAGGDRLRDRHQCRRARAAGRDADLRPALRLAAPARPASARQRVVAVRAHHRFDLSSAGGEGSIGSGVMDEIWRAPGFPRPFLAFGAWRNIMFPETGLDVPFTIENWPYVDRFGRETVTFVRSFELPASRRRFDATMVWSEQRGCVVDYLGTHQHLAADVHLSVHDAGGLRLRTGAQRCYGRRVGFSFPMLLSRRRGGARVVRRRRRRPPHRGGRQQSALRAPVRLPRLVHRGAPPRTPGGRRALGQAAARGAPGVAVSPVAS